MKLHSILCCLMLLAIGHSGVQAQSNGRVTIPLKHGSDHPGIRTDEAMACWRGHGLGQFIHWGVYAIPGGEWDGKTYSGAAEWIRSWNGMPNADYDNLYKQFNPKDFNAKKWARQAKEMGVGHMIFTTKHHDGFCMWPSKYTDYTVSNTPYGKDIVGQIVDAYTAEGIDVHLYFSVMDWNHGGWLYKPPVTDGEKAKWEAFKQFTRNQLLELLDNYPAIKGLWFDGTWDESWVNEAEFAHDLEKELRAKSPGLIIGSRYRADEFGNRQYDANGDQIGDYDQTWERDIPASADLLNGNDWECCMTILENGWGYAKKWTSYAKTPFELLSMLSECNSLGGNFVLNFGPDGDGNIRSEEARIAAAIGKWMAVNGEAVRGAGPVAGIHGKGWGFMTGKDDKLYLHIYNRPISDKVRIEFDRKTYVPGRAVMLKDGERLEIIDAGRNKRNGRLFDICLPAGMPTEPFVIELELIRNMGQGCLSAGAYVMPYLV